MSTPIRILIDLNPILDVLQKRQPFYPASASVLAAAETDQVEGYISAHSITTLFYLLAKDQSAAVARMAISDLLTIFQVAAVDRLVIDRALVMNLPDFEDAVQVAAAQSVGADYVITRNIGDFRRSPVKAILPVELLTLL
jgi:predicted nucleic acid-binding protein